MYQKLIIIGNLGKAPEMKYLPDGKAVTSFSMATSRKYNDKEEVAWFKVSVWGKQAESCSQYLDKGSRVLIEGRLKADASGNPVVFKRGDGSYGSSFEVHADTVRFMSPKPDVISDAPEVPYDDIPF